MIASVKMDYLQHVIATLQALSGDHNMVGMDCRITGTTMILTLETRLACPGAPPLRFLANQLQLPTVPKNMSAGFNFGLPPPPNHWRPSARRQHLVSLLRPRQYPPSLLPPPPGVLPPPPGLLLPPGLLPPPPGLLTLPYGSPMVAQLVHPLPGVTSWDVPLPAQPRLPFPPSLGMHEDLPQLVITTTVQTPATIAAASGTLAVTAPQLWQTPPPLGHLKAWSHPLLGWPLSVAAPPSHQS